ncbi:MAG: hypothetical protein IT158_13900 [Bryobacterales bacterium]|nr:hypothetical protein [Bryobacterales bacterium]
MTVAVTPSLKLPAAAADPRIVDERGQLRIFANQPASVTVLGEPERVIRGRIVDHSPQGLGLDLEGPVPYGAAVKISWENRILLGEVCYCRTGRHGCRAGIRVKHVLLDTNELARLRRRILGEDPLLRTAPVRPAGT